MITSVNPLCCFFVTSVVPAATLRPAQPTRHCGSVSALRGAGKLAQCAVEVVCTVTLALLSLITTGCGPGAGVGLPLGTRCHGARTAAALDRRGGHGESSVYFLCHDTIYLTSAFYLPQTPLCLHMALAQATSKGHAAIVKLLLEHGADPSHRFSVRSCSTLQSLCYTPVLLYLLLPSFSISNITNTEWSDAAAAVHF